jgi:hypothetical protein
LDVSRLEPKLLTDDEADLPLLASIRYPSSKKRIIKPNAPLGPLGSPDELQDCFTAAPHLIPMIRLIDQVQEYRGFLTADEQRPMLYDMVDVVIRRGLEGLLVEDAWREQDESALAKEDVVGVDGSPYRPWRSIRVERKESEVLERHASYWIGQLETEARAWNKADERRCAKEA